MTVYVDDMKAEYLSARGGRRYVFSHMVADTSEELHAMASTIGVQHKWLQYGGTYREHFDIVQSKRKLAVKAGAKEVTQREIGEIIRRKREGS